MEEVRIRFVKVMPGRQLKLSQTAPLPMRITPRKTLDMVWLNFVLGPSHLEYKTAIRCVLGYISFVGIWKS